MRTFQKTVALIFLSLFFLWPAFSVKATCGCYSAGGICTQVDSGIPTGSETNEVLCQDYCLSNFDAQYSTTHYVSSKWEDSSNPCSVNTVSSSTNVVDRTSSATSSSTISTGVSSTTYEKPILGINIPTISFSEILVNNGYLEVNWLSEYINGLYQFLLSVGGIFAVLMLMVGGLSYVVSRGNSGDITKAKERITNALTGTVLLFAVFIILYTVNPQLTSFSSLRIIRIDQLLFEQSLDGDDAGTGSGSPANLAGVEKRCKDMIDEAKDPLKNQSCTKIPEGFASPTGFGPSCGNHHWGTDGANWIFTNMSGIDYKNSFGSALKAPFSGNVTYIQGTEATNEKGRCGNQIKLTSSNGEWVSLCHVKDFLDGSGSTITTGSKSVKQGDIIGHLGGACCSGETHPSAWKYGTCAASGTPCSNPFENESCTCQPVEQSGNTSGPHVHIEWHGSGSNLLNCLKD